jgi:hypothetical protein
MRIGRFCLMLTSVAGAFQFCNSARADWRVSTFIKPGQRIFTLDQADAVAADSQNRVGTGLYSTFNSEDEVNYGYFPNGNKPPGLTAADTDFFVVTGTGYLNVPEGDYKFALLDDDQGRLRLDGNAIVTETANHAAFYPQEVRYSAEMHLSQGLHPIDVLYFEVSGFAGGEVFLVDANNTPIALVGDAAHGGFEVTQNTAPEPGMVTVLAVGAMVAVGRRRK